VVERADRFSTPPPHATPMMLNPKEEGKILGIELLRFVSALAVLVFHYQHFAFVGGAPADFVASRQPFYSILRLFYDYGYYGVQVFWCISGFIFFWKYGDSISRAKVSGYAFFILRVSRLYPLHFVTLLFVAAMQLVYFAHTGSYFVYQNNDLHHFILQLFMASNWGLHTGDSFNGPIWSISIEVLVYGIFFLLLRYVSGSVLCAALVAATAALIQLLKISDHPVFACLFFFYIGGLTATAYQKTSARGSLQMPASACALLLALVLLTAVLLLHIKAKFFLALFTPAVIFLFVAHVPASPLAARWLMPAGNMTYSSYLLHVPIQIAVVTCFIYSGVKIPFYNPAFFLLFMAVTLLLSHLTYVGFEMPAQRMIRRHFLQKAAAIPKAQSQDA
jgi:peptidoglycan/LPS O-acetylase OafA/YrhL